MNEPAAHRALLAFVLASGLALRVWGIGFGLPHPMTRPDEEFIVSVALGFFAGDFNPHFFEWPSLYFYVVHALLRVVYVAGHLTGAYPDAAAFTASVASDPGWVHLLLRCLSVAAAMGTIILVHGIGRRLAGRRVAAMAAAFLAVAYLHVRDSHFGVLDVPLTFLIVVAIALLVIAWRSERAAMGFALAGLAAGLASSVKYNAAALLVPAAVTMAVGPREDRAGSGLMVVAAGFGAAFVLGFVAGTPYAVLDSAAFREGLTAQVTRLTEGHGVLIERVWLRHLTFSLFYGVGWPLLAFALAGIVMSLAVDWRRWAIVFSFPIAYFVVIGGGHTAFIRYVTPLVPFLCIAAALAVERSIALLLPGASPRKAAAALGAVAILAAMPSVITAIRFDRMVRRDDTRVLAAGWLRKEMRAGEILFESGASYARPHYAWTGGADFIGTEFDERRAGFLTRTGSVVEPDWIVLAESPLRLYTQVPGSLRGVLASRYRQVEEFAASREPEAESLFDRQDAFFLPYADFSRRDRPGPNLTIYRLADTASMK